MSITTGGHLSSNPSASNKQSNPQLGLAFGAEGSTDIIERRDEAECFRQMVKRQIDKHVATMLANHTIYLDWVADGLNADSQEVGGAGTPFRLILR
jgi:hypothetical protein